MPVTWTPENDRRLLLLVLELTKVNNNDIAKRWGEKYVDEKSDQPTARAISERLYKLKHSVGSGKANGASPKVPHTPSKPRPISINKPRTPTSSAKKRKFQYGGDDHDDEDEEPSMSEIKSESDEERKYLDPERTSHRYLPGRSSKLARSYVEQSDDNGSGPTERQHPPSQFMNGIAQTNGFRSQEKRDVSASSDYGEFT